MNKNQYEQYANRYRLAGKAALCLAAMLCCVLLTGTSVADTSLQDNAADAVVAVFPERFPPTFNVTPNGLPTGFGIELMEAVAERAHLKVTYRSVPDWAAALDELRSGRADLIPNLGITDERRRIADFTRPVEREPLQLFVRVRQGTPESLQGFLDSDRVIAVVSRNAATHLLANEPGIRTREYDHLADALVALFDDHVDGLVYPRSMLEALAVRLGIGREIKAVGEPLLTVERAIAVAKGRYALRTRLDDALAEILDSASYRQIYDRWHEPAPPFWTARRVGYLVVGLLVLGLLASIFVRVRVLNRINRQLKDAKIFTEGVLNAALEAIFTLDRHGTIRSANSSTERIFARTAAELVGAHVGLLLPQGEAEQLVLQLSAIRQLVSPGGRHDENFSEYQAFHTSGELFPIRMGIAAVQAGSERLFVCTVQDLSRQREAEQQASYYVDHDPLTGMLNQRGAMLVLESMLSQAARYGRSLACVNLGIDRLSHVNDVYGRQVGDSVLTIVAEHLRNTLRDSDVLGHADSSVLARAGGDRFLAIMPETGAEGARRAAERILAAVEQHPLQCEDVNLHVNCRAGIAVCPEHGATAQVLISHAESALHLAKQQAVSPIRMFSLNDQVEERLVEHWVERIRRGLRDDCFELHFQPIRHIASGDIHHFECLVRYRAEDGQLLQPGAFIPIAERFGLIRQLDIRILEMAISHLAGLEAAGRDVALSINISGAHIGDDQLFNWLERLLEEHAVDPAHIIIEITETAAMHNMLRARSFVESLRALGFRIALDDFGVGFSSFSHLRNLPVDIVKIDGTFVRHLTDNSEDRVLVKALTDIAHSLGKQVIAEFVCSEPIMALIRGYGVDYAQGYHVGKPLPLEQQLPPLPEDRLRG